MTGLFQKNPRNVRITAWVLALGAATAWYQYDKKKAMEFSARETQRWNEEVLRNNPPRTRKEKKAAAQYDSSA